MCAVDVSTMYSLPSRSLPEGTGPDPGHQSPLPTKQCLCRPCHLLPAPPASLTPSNPTVPQIPRVCTEAEFACHSYNECVALEYRCDQRPDCRDMSDELDCGEGLSGGTVACRCHGRVRVCLGPKSVRPVTFWYRQRGLREVGGDVERALGMAGRAWGVWGETGEDPSLRDNMPSGLCPQRSQSQSSALSHPSWQR